jgi:hypothetical protein
MHSALNMLRRTLLLVGLSLLMAPVGMAAEAAATKPLQFNRDIRPILVENCFACHGADSAARKADLRLDKRDAAIEFGAIVPGKLDKSSAWERITSTDPEMIMPPPASHKKLKPEERELLKRWIAEGAEYQPHWSFLAPQKHELPAVKNKAWVRNPLDQFILAELEEASLAPTAEADRRTLARRLSLDLTGLPPTPKAVEAFVADTHDDYYERYVDQLMATPQWGEHRARYWLDYARYGDTHGIHFDNYREMWSYRDWLIGAFNRNLTYDQFTLENLAGDLLPNATLEQKIGSGFNRCNITTNEGGIIDEEYLVLYTRDRTEATSQIWLGLTTQCAVCHDHKFDPVSQKEFYQLAAFFNNTTQAAKDGNVRNTPPIIQVPSLVDQPRFEKLTVELAAANAKLEERKKAAEPEFKTWLADATAEKVLGQEPREKLHLQIKLNEGTGSEVACTVDEEPVKLTFDKGYKWVAGKTSDKALAIEDNKNTLELPQAGNFKDGDAFSFGAWIQLPKKGYTGAVFARMDEAAQHRGWDLWLQNDRIGTHIISAWPENALKVVAKTPLKVKQWHHVFVSYDGSKKQTGLKIYIDGVLQPFDVEADKLTGDIATDVSWKLGQRHTSSRTAGLQVQDVRIFARSLSGSEIASIGKNSRLHEILAKPADKRDAKDKNELRDYWLTNFDPVYKERVAAVEKLQKEEVDIKSRGTIAHVMNEKPSMPKAFILNRGEYDQRKDEVAPSIPAALPKFSDDLPKNRLGLAKWLLLPEHPLTSRVAVNRMWQELFGTGIVRTAGDFGIAGELPTHPELLDWMAVEFREKNWDMKQFYKTLVMSATYRQAAQATPEKLLKDPANRLLSRGPRFRMDAEMVRDYALAATGIMVPKIGGPSVRPYQPPGVWEAVAMPGSDTRTYKQDKGENLYRRSMYTFVKRAAPPASLEIFNATNRELCTVRRERTNTPLQALVTLNDPQFVEAARHLAQTVLLTGAADDLAKLDQIARRLLSRPLKPSEQEIITASLADLRTSYKGKPDEAKQLITVGDSKPDEKLAPEELAAWTMLVNELLNLDEVLNK